METKSKPSKGFIWFDRPEEGRKGFLTALGTAMQGVAAPFAGDNTWGSRFAAQQNAEAEQRYRQWTAEQAAQRQSEEDTITMLGKGFTPSTPQDIQSQAMLSDSRGGWGQPYQQPNITLGGRQFSYNPELQRQQIMNNMAAMAPFMAMQGGGQGLGVTGMTIGASGKPSIQIGETPEMKIENQAKAAQAKEAQLMIGKANRLEDIGNTVKDEWLKTSPYKGFITKTGLVPLLGTWDIIKKGFGATESQRQDQVYADFVKGIRAQLARGMGDVGNLSEYEQKAVLDLLPRLTDSYELGVKRFEQLGALTETIRKQRQKQGYSEFNLEGKMYKIPYNKVNQFMKDKGIESYGF
jgi:hypothetical protein